jgi:hypothetical protein
MLIGVGKFFAKAVTARHGLANCAVAVPYAKKVVSARFWEQCGQKEFFYGLRYR